MNRRKFLLPVIFSSLLIYTFSLAPSQVLAKSMEIEEGTTYTNTTNKDDRTIVTTKTYRTNGVYITTRTYDSSNNLINERTRVNALKDHVVVVPSSAPNSAPEPVVTQTQPEPQQVTTTTTPTPKQMEVVEGTTYSHTQTKGDLTVTTTKTYQRDGVYITIRIYDVAGELVREREVVNPIRDHVSVVARTTPVAEEDVVLQPAIEVASLREFDDSEELETYVDETVEQYEEEDVETLFDTEESVEFEEAPQVNVVVRALASVQNFFKSIFGR